jgi:hypothetical protein
MVWFSQTNGKIAELNEEIVDQYDGLAALYGAPTLVSGILQ